jgi:AcrR family transcriptional regulator
MLLLLTRKAWSHRQPGDPSASNPALPSQAVKDRTKHAEELTHETGPSQVPRLGTERRSGVSLKADRREEILKAARVVLSDKGYEATTVSEIVGKAGVAQGTFYLYFPSKTSLIMALTELMIASLTRAARSAADEAGSLTDAVLGVVGASFAQASDFRDVMAIVRARGDGPRDGSSSDREQEPFAAFFIEFIQKWQALGAADPAIDGELSGGILASMVVQTISRLYARYEGAPPASHVEEVARIVLRALEAPRG